MPSLRDFLGQVEAGLDPSRPAADELAAGLATEPVRLDDLGDVVAVAPTAGGLVGLDVDTGTPVRVRPGWPYRSVAEKPVIITAGGRQTVLPPRSQPAPAGPPPGVDPAAAAALYDALVARSGTAARPEGARRLFVAGCLADPGFYARQRALFAGPETAAAPPTPRGRPPAYQRRQRIVDT
jgi:hypothetical protein